MSDLANWIETHIEQLVEAAASKMVRTDFIREQVEQVEESVRDFFESFCRTVRQGNPIALNAILIDWIEARPMPTTQEEGSALLPALSSLKQALWDQIAQHAELDEALAYMRASDRIFTQATHFLAGQEAALLLQYVSADLERAKNDVERLDKGKSDFIAVAAHELKTPLTLIEGYNNMLNAQFPPDQHPDVALMLDGIAKGAGRLREIIQDMIDVSMIDMSLIELHFQPVWLRRLIDAVHYDLRDKLQMRGITMTIDYESIPTTPTHADPERLYQVLNKVISNAIKYTPDGGHITISSNTLPGFLDLTITDTGIGIDPENLVHIFEKFSSLNEVATHSSGKVKFKGAGPGLGLAIAKGLMDAHEGTIWAESEGYDEQKCPGSTFHIMIPMRNAPPEDQMANLFEGANGHESA